jgi:pSer/pThr/pTyr-binding forkhead associated (FHA) protein
MGRLILMFKDKVIDIYPLSSGEAITIGRRHDNRIVIENLAVSGRHARIDIDGDTVTLADLQSKNGTFVNGRQVSEYALQHKDTIVIGKHNLVFDLHDEVEVDVPDESARASEDGPSAMSDAKTMFLDTPHGRQLRGEEAPPPPPPEPVYAEKDNLLFLAGGEGEVSLAKPAITIGKNSDADILVSGFWGFLAGRPAATISKQAGDYFLRFSGGLIKPRRNGSGVKGTVKLNHEDVLEVGPVKVRVQLRKRADMD